MTVAPDTNAIPGEQAALSARRIGPAELLLMISSIMALMALAIDLLLPAFDDIRDHFGLPEDSTRVSQTITVFFLGLAIAQLVWGPLSDRYGRKPILYAGITIYVGGAIICAFAPSMTWLLVGRFVWGVGAAGSRVVATAVIRDSFEGTQMAKALSQIMAVFVMAPVFAPSIGAGLISLFSWRAIFWFCVAWSAGLVIWSMRLPETLNPTNQRPLEFASIRSGFGTVVRHPITAGYTLAALFLQGVFTAYLGSSERLIDRVFGRGEQFPLIFGAIAIFFAVAAVVNSQVVGRFGMRRLIHVTLGGTLTLSVALVALSLANDGEPNFWVFMPLLGLMLALFMFMMPNLNTAALEPMGAIAGTASSVTGATRIAGGAVLGAVVDAKVIDSTTPFAIATVVFLALTIVCVILAERAERSARATA